MLWEGLLRVSCFSWMMCLSLFPFCTIYNLTPFKIWIFTFFHWQLSKAVQYHQTHYFFLLQPLLMIVLASVGFKTFRLYLNNAASPKTPVNFNFSDLHQRHPGSNGLPEMSLRGHQWSLLLPPYFGPLNSTKLFEINASSPKHQKIPLDF